MIKILNKEKAKEEIKSILIQSVSKDSFVNGQVEIDPGIDILKEYEVYKSIQKVLDKYKLNGLLSYNIFIDRFSKFKKAYKEYPGRAVNNFLSFLDKKLPVTRLPEIPQIPKNKKSIGKITREDDLKYYRLLYEYFTEDTSHLHPLIALKSYRLENYCYEDKSIYYSLFENNFD